MREIDLQRMKRYGLKPSDFKAKKEESKDQSIIEDEQGNKYKQTISNGQTVLVLVEDYRGIMYL